MEKQTNIEHLVALLTEVLSKGIHASSIRKIMESEARSLSARIKEITGHTISSKTLGNYYKAASTERWSDINPTLFTLDILALFVLSKENISSPPSENGLNWLKFQHKQENNKLSVLSDINPQYKPGRKKREVILLLSFVIVSLITCMVYSNLKTPKDFYDPFDEVSYASLIERGWKFLDLDTQWLNKQIKPGYLTLYTLPGDHYVKPNEKAFVKNTLLYKIDPSNEVQIEVNLEDFKPSQPYQQAGLILINKNKNVSNLVRYNFSYGQKREIFNSLDCFSDVQILDIVGIENKNVYLINSSVMTGWADARGNLVNMNRLSLQIAINNFDVKFSARSGDSHDMFQKIQDYKINFLPAYIGIFAFQGQTDQQYNPWNADTIPALMDYFKITYFKTK